MLDKEAMKLFGRQLRTNMPVQSGAPLPSDLLRLVEALKAGDAATSSPSSSGRLRKAA